MAIGAVALVLAAGAGVALWRNATGEPATAPRTRLAAIDGARAVPGGIEVEFVGFDPSAPQWCRSGYEVSGEPGATPGEIVVTVTATPLPPTPSPAPTDLVCDTVGAPHTIVLEVAARYDTVRDASNGRVHPVR